LSKKLIIILSACLVCLATVGIVVGVCCFGKTEDAVELSIPAITVDLRAPENKVGVPVDLKSEVTDSDGRKLTDDEWLLGCKFSKAYIKSLGVGDYVFAYKSEKAYGTIRLTVTDNEKPAYLFEREIPEEVPFFSDVLLPGMVKEQDSYQDDCEPSYRLTENGSEISFKTVDGKFFAESLAGGKYEWIATIVKGGKVYEYKQEFMVSTFGQWLKSIENELIFNVQTGEYLTADNGVYTVDTSANNGDFFFNVDNSVLRKAISAGKTRVCVEVVTDKAVYGGEEHTGSMWLSNGWKGYVWAFSGKDEYDEDTTGDNSTPPRISGMKTTDDGKYRYYTTGFLKEEYFSAQSKNPLQLQFANKARVNATLKISFE